MGVSIIALLLIQRFMKKSDEHQPAVGANRFSGSRGLVIEAIDRVAGVGRVRVETENWRATTDGDPIPAGTEVRVVEIRGTRHGGRTRLSRVLRFRRTRRNDQA